MKSADRLQARYTAILGEDELARGEIALKSMETGGGVRLDWTLWFKNWFNRRMKRLNYSKGNDKR